MPRVQDFQRVNAAKEHEHLLSRSQVLTPTLFAPAPVLQLQAAEGVNLVNSFQGRVPQEDSVAEPEDGPENGNKKLERGDEAKLN